MVLAALAERVCHSAWVCGALIGACAFLFRQCNVGAFSYSRCKPDGLRLFFCPPNFCGIGQCVCNDYGNAVFPCATMQCIFFAAAWNQARLWD